MSPSSSSVALLVTYSLEPHVVLRIGKGGVILTKEGHPVLDQSGQPMIAGDTVHHGGGIIPPGGSIGAGGVVLDANGVSCVFRLDSSQ